MRRMDRIERRGRRFLDHWEILRLRGTPLEAKEALLSWAKGAFRRVYGGREGAFPSGKHWEDILFCVEGLIVGLERGARYDLSYYYSPPRDTFLGAFYRMGEAVRLGVIAANLVESPDRIYPLAYSLLTREDPRGTGTPPGDPLLLARAIAFPERAPLLERLDLVRRNLRILEGRLPPSLARPLAKAVPWTVLPHTLQVFDGVALYWEEREGAWYLVFDGRAHRLKGEAWEIARSFLRKRKGTPLERARMAMTVVGLREWA